MCRSANYLRNVLQDNNFREGWLFANATKLAGGAVLHELFPGQYLKCVAAQQLCPGSQSLLAKREYFQRKFTQQTS